MLMSHKNPYTSLEDAIQSSHHPQELPAKKYGTLMHTNQPTIRLHIFGRIVPVLQNLKYQTISVGADMGICSGYTVPI